MREGGGGMSRSGGGRGDGKRYAKVRVAEEDLWGLVDEMCTHILIY